MSDAEHRIRTVPWEALAGLGAILEPALAQVLTGRPAERVLDSLLRAHKTFTDAQRAVVAEAVFGVGLWRRRLRACTNADAAPLELLAALAIDLGGRPDAAQWLGLAPISLRPLPALWRDRLSFPDWLADCIEQDLGTAAASFAAALNLPGPVCLRVNSIKASPDTVAQQLSAEGVTTRPGRWAQGCLVVTSPRPNIYGLSGSQAGHFEVQDEGSQLLGQALGALPGHDVLDLCAGAGGKSLQLAAQLHRQGRVFSVDLDLARLERLRTRADRAGAVVHIVGRAPPAGLLFDRVLVDAPCSELGALRRGPDLRWRLDPAHFAALERTQRELLARAAALVKPGGRVLYATCTTRAQENHAVVAEFLAAQPVFRRVPPTVPAELLDAAGDLRLFPHAHGTDGFYAAALERTR